MTDHRRQLRILFAPETFNLGETSRAVEVARRLRDMGHVVRFMGYSRRFVDRIDEAGFAIELLEPELSEDEADQMIAVDQGRSLRHPFTTAMLRRRVASELALLDRWRPECVVIGSTLSMFISARAASVPLFYVRPYALSRGHLARMRALPVSQGHSWVGSRVNRLAGSFVRGVVPRIRWRPASFRRVAAEHRVVLPVRTSEAFDADLSLIASLFPHLDGQDMESGEVAVGPIYAESPGEVPATVAALAKAERPVVYVGLGSSANRRIALGILHQLAALDIEVISTAGRYLHERDRHRLPGNVHVYDSLPAHRLAGLIDASVVHGGEGTVQTACASGVPFAGVGLQTEQRFNIDECVRYGNALRFTPRDIRRRRLPRLVTRLLADRTMRDAARRLQGKAQPVGAENAAREIVRAIIVGRH